MPHEPSFYQLYRRSLYSGENLDSEATPRQNRTEVFAVAALGFTLKHDAKFREFFLKHICEADKSIRPSECQVKCQAADCSDLAIVMDKTAAFIVEAKIRAVLQDQQKPWHPQFDDVGYGAQIRREYKNYPQKHYIVLQNQSEQEMCDSRPDGKEPIKCSSRTWADLASFGHGRSELVDDLVDSLAEFDIPSLKTRILGGKRMKEHTSNTAAMYQLLATIAERYGFDRKTIDANHSSDSDYFGLEIPPGPVDRFIQLKAAVQNRGKLGWFGFESDNQGNNLAVWFYCGPGAREKAEEFVKKRGLSKGRDEEDAFCVTQEPDFSGDDLSWFVSVFDTLQDDKVAEDLRNMMDKTLWPDVADRFKMVLGR